MFNTQTLTIQASGAVTTGGNSASHVVDRFSQGILFLDVTAVSGTSPSMTLTIETSADGATWFDSGQSFTAVTAVGKQIIRLNGFGGYLRIVRGVTGTTPSITYSLLGVFKNS